MTKNKIILCIIGLLTIWIIVPLIFEPFFPEVMASGCSVVICCRSGSSQDVN